MLSMFSSIQEIEQYLASLIPNSNQLRFPKKEGIIRTKEFLKLLGSPQNKLKVVHVAGTSGKGSTSFMISNLLAAHGFKVGLSLSPHLLDIRERLEINNELIAKEKFIMYFEKIKPAIEKMNMLPFGKITYFEAMVGMTYYVLHMERVDYAVIETGLGGEFDGTNICDRGDKLSVLSKIGFDHMKVLGNTLTKIAHQKAMICAQGGELITIHQFPTAAAEIKKVVHQKQGHLFTVEKKSLTSVILTNLNTVLSFHWGSVYFKNITLGLLGAHQAQNVSLALAVMCHLAKRDSFSLNVKAIASTLKTLRFKGRFDIVQLNKSKVILDGAHNVPKMKALLRTLKKLYPDKKFTFILAFKKGKEYKKMIQLIIPYAKKMIITHIFSESQDLQHFSLPPESISREISKLGFSNAIVMKSIQDITSTIKKSSDAYVISGSLYLLGDIYKQI